MEDGREQTRKGRRDGRDSGAPLLRARQIFGIDVVVPDLEHAVMNGAVAGAGGAAVAAGEVVHCLQYADALEP